MKVALNLFSFLTNFVLFCYLLQELYYDTFFFYNIYMRKKSEKMFNFPTFIAITLEHIHIYINYVCAKVKMHVEIKGA